MKTKLEFEFTEEDDKGMAKVYTQSLDMYFALNELKDRMRSICKYGDAQYEKCETSIDTIEKFREEFFELMTSHGIDLDILS